MPPSAPEPTPNAYPRAGAGAWLLAAALLAVTALATLALGPPGLAVGAVPALAAMAILVRRLTAPSARPRRADDRAAAELVHQEERARLELALRQLAGEREEGVAFQRLLSAASAEADLAPLAAALLAELLGAADAHAGALYVLDERDENGALTRLAASGLDGANVPDRIIPNAGLAGRSAAEGRPALAGHGEAGIELATFAGPVRVHHELHLPIVHRERVLAVASLARLGEPGFPDAARARLARLAAPAALALAGALSRLAAQRSAAAYEAVLESAPDAYAAIDERGIVVAWSPRAEELFGHPRMDAVGEPLEELVVPRHLRHRFRRLLEESRSAGSGARSFEFSARDRRGHSLPIELSLAAAREAGAGTTLHGFLRDLRDRAAADRARELQRAVSALVGGRPGETLMDELLVLLAQRLEASLALWWAPAERPGSLRCEACWCEPGLPGGEELRRAATRAQPVGEGLAGRAWHAEEPVTVRVDAGLEGLDAAPRAAAAMTAGLRSMLAIPVTGPDGPAGVLELARRDDAPLPGPMLDALMTVGVLAGHALAASRAGRPALGALGQPVPSRTDAQGADSDLAA